MSIQLEMHIQCDVCGNELDEKYPPTEYARTLADFHLAPDRLASEATHRLKNGGWSYDVNTQHTDPWGNPTVIRCPECKRERK